MTFSRLGALGILMAALVALGCPAAEEPEPSEQAEAPSAAGPAQAPALAPGLLGALGNQNEKIHAAPRTGILAEQKRYSLFDEELIIRDYFQDRRDGFFVDVGCAWPIKASNTYYLEKHLGWKGIGIDALDDYAPLWERDRPGSKFFAYLVTDRSGGFGTFFKSPNTGLSSTDRKSASGSHFGDSLEPVEVKIPQITLDDLLAREGVTKIDLLSMDIEGHEPEALEGFSVQRYHPELVVVEGKSPRVARYFRRHGYERLRKYEPYDNVNRYFHPRR